MSIPTLVNDIALALAFLFVFPFVFFCSELPRANGSATGAPLNLLFRAALVTSD